MNKKIRKIISDLACFDCSDEEYCREWRENVRKVGCQKYERSIKTENKIKVLIKEDIGNILYEGISNYMKVKKMLELIENE